MFNGITKYKKTCQKGLVPVNSLIKSLVNKDYII